MNGGLLRIDASYGNTLPGPGMGQDSALVLLLTRDPEVVQEPDGSLVVRTYPIRLVTVHHDSAGRLVPEDPSINPRRFWRMVQRLRDKWGK